MIFRLTTSALIMFAVFKMAFGADFPGWNHLGVFTRVGGKVASIFLGH